MEIKQKVVNNQDVSVKVLVTEVLRRNADGKVKRDLFFKGYRPQKYFKLR